MNRLLLASRTIRVQSSSPFKCAFNRSLSTTSCRKFRSTGAVSKRSRIHAVPDAFFGGEEEPIELPNEPETSKTLQTTRHQKKQPAEASPDFLAAEASPAPKTSAAPETREPLPTHTLELFNPNTYLNSWSDKVAHAALASRGMSQFEYIVSLLETDMVLDCLSTLEMKEMEEFERRFILYEKGRPEESNLVQVLDFFLRRGVKMLPPSRDSLEPENCVASMDPGLAIQVLDHATEGPWRLTEDMLQKRGYDKIPFPDLMTPDALLDPRDVVNIPATDKSYGGQIIVRNHRSVFHSYSQDPGDDLLEEDEIEVNQNAEADEMLKALPVPTKYYHDLHQSILMRRSVVQQTGKGKIRRIAFMVLVGDGNGLIGMGEGKHENGMIALKKARLAAVRNMDWVERFEKRTIWSELSSKLGATQVILRPRPVGFGLRCNPFLHQILRAAGMKDISAKVWGSRNRLNVIKAAFRMLQAGHAPTGMGDGIGGKGKKMSKGRGLVGKHDVERARGRKLVSLRV